MNTFEIVNLIQITCPSTFASIKGQGIEGTFFAYPYCNGSVIVVEVSGLPSQHHSLAIHALHIHEGDNCGGNAGDPFKNTKGHFTLNDKLHPFHTGDLPPLFTINGYAWMCVYTARFTPNQIVDRTVVIHSDADDFHTQPSGNSGAKIACGVIKELYQ